MSASSTKTWLVAYDIRDPRRLKRVHRRLRKEGATVQYSAFSVQADDARIKDLLTALDLLIDAGQDDIRAYHLPQRCPVWMLGLQGMPEGVYIDAGDASKLLMAATTQPQVEPACTESEDLSFL